MANPVTNSSSHLAAFKMTCYLIEKLKILSDFSKVRIINRNKNLTHI